MMGLSISMKCVFKLLLLAILCQACFGQTARSTVSGTVSDPQGAVVVGAKVRLLNSKKSFSTVTGKKGEYAFSVPAGRYKLKTRVYFFDDTSRDVLVTQGEAIKVDVTLQLDPVCHTALSKTETRALEKKHFILLKQWGDFGLAWYELRFLPSGKSFYRSRNWDRRGETKRDFDIGTRGFEELENDLFNLGFATFEECSGHEEIDSGFAQITIASPKVVRLLTALVDPPKTFLEMRSLIEDRSGVMNKEHKLKQ